MTTEHFTRAEVVALAMAKCGDMHGDLLHMNPEQLHAFAEDCVTAKQAEWEAQGAVAEVLWYDPSAGGNAFVGQRPCKIIDASLAFFDSAPIGTKLYTHALPAQPAEPVNAELVEADAVEAITQVMEQAQVFASSWALVGGIFDQGNAMDDADEEKAELRTMVASLARAALSRAQAAPSVGVPDSCLWTPDTNDETNIHYSACGEAWSFIEGGPKENNVRFCQGCGKPVVIASAQPQQKEG